MPGWMRLRWQLLALPAVAHAGGRQLQGSKCPSTPALLHDSWGCPAEHLSSELLSDPEFTSSGAWTTYLKETGGALFDFPGHGIIVNPLKADDDPQPWHVQLTQPVELQQGGEEGSFYSLCLHASALEAGMIQFAVDADGALNFAVAGGGVRSQLTMSADGELRSKCFNFKLGPAATQYTGRVALDLGAIEGKVEVCQASLRRCAVRPQVGGVVPVRRCHLAPLVEGAGCSLVKAQQGKEFSLNAFGQETSGKLACLEQTRSLKGNTFVFSVGRCEVWQCGSRSMLIESATGEERSKDVFSELCEFDEPTGGWKGQQRRSPVYVQLWEWNFDDIATECTNYLGPNGFDGVQVAPVTEHILGTSWYTKYQPVGFQLNSRSGSQEQFQNMVATCRRAGVQIIVDVVLNHIAAPCIEAKQAGGAPVMPCKGWAGSPFGNRRINSNDGWKGPEMFHNINGNILGNCPVEEDTWTCPQSNPPGDCSLCDFKGLPDWNTGMQSVRDTLVKHLEELFTIGVTMIRIDAASYMSAEDLASIVNHVPWDLVYQEWWGGIPEEKRSTSVGHYRDGKYGLKITDALAVQDVKYMADALNITYGLEGIPSERSIYPLTFHDQRTTLADRFVPTYKNGLEFHQQQKFLLAWPHGNGVRLFGGYTWKTLDDGPPGNCGTGRCMPAPAYSFGKTQPPRCMATPTQSPLSSQDEMYSGWVCEHRWDGVAGLVNFRKACRGLPIRQTWSESTTPAVDQGQFAYRVGDKCFAALVRGHNERWENYWGKLSDWRLAGLDIGLPPGRYCDLASLATLRCWSRKRCPREVVIGENGQVLTGTVRPGDLLAIHTDARLDNSTATNDCDFVDVEEDLASGLHPAPLVLGILLSFLSF